MSTRSISSADLQRIDVFRENSLKETLSGEKAFYKRPDYLKKTEKEFALSKPLPASYTWNTEHKIIRVVKLILSILVFPVIIYGMLHALAGKIVLPASSQHLHSPTYADTRRSEIPLQGEWKYKRLTVEMDGYKIDAMIIGTPSTLENGRWLLASNGNNEFYEDKFCCQFKHILSELNGNAIVFNYPGVGASTGWPNRNAMAKAYRAMLTFLEDKEKGIGAREIIGYGHSIGGGVQGDALKTHQLRKDIKYVFVKSRTFSDLSKVVSGLTNKLLGFLVKILGWNMSSVESSKKLKVPEIILQSADVRCYEELCDSSKIVGDTVISAKASLARALLEDKSCPRENKLLIGMPESHNGDFIDPSFWTRKINGYLK